MTPKRPTAGAWERMPDLRVRMPEFDMVQHMERWYHTATRTSVCSSVDPVHGEPTYHLSILGRKPAELVLLDFGMAGAEEVNVGKPEARHFWLKVPAEEAA
jgi:hypothetical protein